MPPAVAAVATFAAASAVNAFVVQIGVSFALSFVARALFKPSTPTVRPAELVRDLEVPNSRPPYRYAYGRSRIYGSPAPWRVKGNKLYGCLIFNSRPSSGGSFRIFSDKREFESFSGDIYNFSGAGMRAQLPAPVQQFPADVRPRFWLGLGSQTQPPQRLIDEAPEFFSSSDAWRGRTVLWVEFDCGETGARGDRWPRVPPEIELEMDWSMVYDPRIGTHSADDESTWSYSNNQALVLLDALRQNPIRRFNPSNLLFSSFVEAADVADEFVGLKAGGNERRYSANGLVIWDGREIEEQIQPLVDCGAGTLVRSGGRLGFVAGKFYAPELTVSDILSDDGVDFQRLVAGRDLPKGVSVSYTNPARDWKESDLPAYQVVGAPTISGDDGIVNLKLPFCTSPTQAMRIQKIAALKAGQQKKLSCVLPPRAFELVAGSAVNLDLPALKILNGLWEVQSVDSGVSLADPDGGVALRVKAELIETSPEIYEWDSSEEIDVVEEIFSAGRATISAPTSFSATTGPTEAIGTQPRVRFSFIPSASTSIDSYEWQWRKVGGIFESGGLIDGDVRDGSSRVFGHLFGVAAGESYEIRVRAVAVNRVSAWLTSDPVEVVGLFAMATGGIIEEPLIDGVRYRVHKFLSNGSFVVTEPGEIEYFLVAGGGGGGSYGGGGGGGVLSGFFDATSQSHAVVVGSGGSGTSSNARGSNGGNSVVFGQTAIGGGGGGGGNVNSSNIAQSGGSGGGGAGGTGDLSGGSSLSSQGNSGGSGNSSPAHGGGGGGAGGTGQSATGSSAGNGGAGTSTNFSGSVSTYAGGGGGGVVSGSSFGSGGAGGGGAGGGNNPGAPNTGGGGGASRPASNSGSGGSGIVILRYKRG